MKMDAELEDLLGVYWDLAYEEGSIKASNGTKANEVLHKIREAWNRRASPASVPAWTHSCNALCIDGLELWIPQCPHCGKPAPTPPVSEDKDKIIAAANALENIASTSSSTRIRRVANEALTAIRARRK